MLSLIVKCAIMGNGNTMKEKITANWIIKCNVECPHCGAYIDLTAIPDMNECLPDVGERDMDANIEVDCPDCQKEFVVNSIEY